MLKTDLDQTENGIVKWGGCIKWSWGGCL